MNLEENNGSWLINNFYKAVAALQAELFNIQTKEKASA